MGTSTAPAQTTAETIYERWDDALGRKDVDAALALYADDASIESPLVRHLLDQEDGVVRGRDALRHFLGVVFSRTPDLRRRYRTGFFTDGTKLMWEYPRQTLDGEQMDFVEVMELHDGLIRRHRVYWGWRGVSVMEKDQYHR
ncbi:MAG TPA: nuclear transport factor 2 family protein [Acidimicrobiia bacterium]|nr:nuclear transport factor 2 family protein [Acidimicrobiia bacterium]HKN91555.1 nuclear transport factor 2 family protein [Acidimicrobiia bacterium]